MKQIIFDLVILGGGCAGLSLARQLANNSLWKKNTLILESRQTYSNDRSWCFWQPGTAHVADDLYPLISHRWQAWRFSGEHFDAIHALPQRHYCFIAAGDFYTNSLSAIKAHDSIEIALGKTVIAIKPHPAGFHLTLEDGSNILAGQIIDTRPPQYLHHKQAKLWQIFYGVEIITEDPVFDPSIVGLMDDLHPTDQGTQFRYSLPFSNRHALIETTLFTPVLQSPLGLKAQLIGWLDKTLGCRKYEITRVEQACLPMGLKELKQRQSESYIYAGTIAGAIRPATGYAFIRIQNWAHECAQELIFGNSLISFRTSNAIVQAMDNIFLNVLHDRPDLGALFFRALSKKVDAAALVRFLSDEAKPNDYWQILNALPTLRFLAYSLGLNRLFFNQKELI